MKHPFVSRAIALLQVLLLLLSMPVYATEEAESEETNVSAPFQDEVQLSRAAHSSLPDLPLTNNPQIEELIRIAQGEYGYSYQSDGTTKYGIWYGIPKGAWCAMFVSWCANQAGIPTSIIAKTGTTDASWYAENGTLHYFFEPWLDNRMQNTIKQHGIYTTRSQYIPKRGDLIYIKWSDTGYSTTFAHVGIVCGVKDGKVYTVEGNSGTGVVRYKSYNLTDTQIRAYATPNYAPAIEYTPGYYQIKTASGLNLRAEPDVSSTLLDTIPNETQLRVYEIQNSVWGRTDYNGTSGWVNLAYTAKQGEFTVTGLEGSTLVYAPMGHDFDTDVRVYPYDTQDKEISYRSSDTDIFTVNENGRVTPISTGTATLYASTPQGYSLEVTVNITPPTQKGSFSEWITVLPPEPDNVERTVEKETRYRYRSFHEIVSDSKETPEGYEPLGAEIQYSNWSEPTVTRDSVEASDLLDVVSQTTYYVYYHYHNTYESGAKGIDSIHYGVGEEDLEVITLTSQLRTSSMADKGGQQAYYNSSSTCPKGYHSYFIKEIYTETAYRTRTSSTVYRYQLSTDWSDWSTTPPEQAQGREIQEIEFLRYSDNEMVSLELLAPPTKTEISARTPLDTEGLRVAAVFSNGERRTLTEGFTLSGYDDELEGKQTITVSYLGCSTTFEIVVTDPNPITLTADPIEGIGGSSHVLEIDVKNNHGLVGFTLYLDYDPSILRLENAKTEREGTVTTTFGADHTCTVSFTAESQTTLDGLLLSLPLTILDDAKAGTHSIVISYDPETTLRLPEKPVRLVVSPASVTVHSYTGKVTTPPTCIDAGVTTYTCDCCGDTYTEPIQPTDEHSYGEWSEVTPPACTADGTRAHSCTVCGSEETEALESTGHTYVPTVVPPTEHEQGYTEYTCDSCGDSYRDTSTEAVGYTVTFKTHDGKVFMTGIQKYGEAVTLPQTAPSREADVYYTYTFDGWDGYTAGMKVEGHLTFTATYQRTEVYYTVTFVDRDGVIYKEDTLTYGAAIVPPANPVKEETELYRYVFQGFDGYEEGMTVSQSVSITVLFEVTPKFSTEITSDVYVIKDSRISGITPNTSVRDLLGSLHQSANLAVFGNDGQLSETQPLATGMTLRLVRDGETFQTLALIVTGDLNGDAKCSLTDFVQLKSHLLAKKTLSGIHYLAADFNGDENVTLTDYVKLRAKLL